MRFTQFCGGFDCSKQNFNYFCLWNFPSFLGYYMNLLTQLSIFDAEQIRNKLVKLRKLLNVENFSATIIAQAPVQTKTMIEKYSCIFWFFRKNNVDDCSFGTTFFAESAKWSLMIGRFLRWINFLWKLDSWEILEKLVLFLTLKTKIYQNFAKWQQFLMNFLEVFDLSDLSKIPITETFAISHDSLFPKLTIYLHTKFSVNSW